MPIVDASLVAPLALNDARTTVAQALMDTWIAAGEELHAPELLPYEVASGLTRAVAAGDFEADGVPAAWQILVTLPLIYHPLGTAGETAVAIARRLQCQSAYDAAYLALALALDAEVWTFDKKLARNAGELGYPVRLVEEAV